MEQINLTNTLAGLKAIQRCMAGEDILFTKLEIGDGVLTTPDISGMTGLINKTKEYPLGAVQAEESEVIRVRSNISNKDVAEDLIIREYGIYAKFGEEQEFLFAYLNVGESTTPLPNERIGRYELNRDFVLYIGNSLHVDFTSNGHLVYVAVNEYKDDMNRKSNVVGTIEDLKNSKKYKVGDVVEVLGYYSAGDGSGHSRQKVAEGYAGKDAIIGVDKSIWRIAHSGEINVSWLGAVGDGLTDDTEALNNAHYFNDITIVYPKKNFVINGHYSPNWVNRFQNYGGIFLSSNQKIIFQGAKLIFTETTTNQGCFFQSQGKENIEIHDAYGVGNRMDVGEFGHGVCIWTSNSGGTEIADESEWSKNIKLYNCTFENMNGDSFYFSGVDGLYFENLKSKKSKRNGLTINAGSNIRGNGYSAYEIGGTSPECAIDIETDFIGKEIRNVFIENINIYNCEYGIWNYTKKAKYSNIKIKNVNIYGAANPVYLNFNSNPNLNDKNSIVEWEDFTFHDTNYTSSTKESFISILDSAKNKGFLSIKNLKLRNTIKVDGNLFKINNSYYPDLNLPNFCIIKDIDTDCDLGLLGIQGFRDESEITFTTSQNLTINDDFQKGYGLYKNYFDVLKSETDFIAGGRAGGNFFVETQDKIFYFFKNALKNFFFLKQGITRIRIRPSVTGDTFLLPDKTVTNIPDIDYNFSIVWNNKIGMFVIEKLSDSSNVVLSLDTPYYSSKMKERGLYELFIDYMNRKLEYNKLKKEMYLAFEERENKEQNYDEWLSEQPMVLCADKDPQPDEKLLKFAIEYTN